MATPHLQESNRGNLKLQHQPKVVAHLSSILRAPEVDSMLLRAMQVGGKPTHLETRTHSPLLDIP